jgi:electron transport complex protein RnfC
MLMRSRAPAVVEGARLLQGATGAARAVIAIESDKPAALAAMRAAVDAAGGARLAVVAVPARYPEGGERQLIQSLTGREVPRGGLPRDVGVVCVNVGTAAAVADAVHRGLPLTSRVVTVTGDGVAAPCNLEARIGAPIADLVAAAGSYTAQATRLIMGGPMMGFALPDDAIGIVKATNCVLVAGPAEAAARVEPQPCIRCGECAQVCPASLLPQQLYWHARAGELDKGREHALDACIECGCCDLVCPSHIPLAAWFRHAKAELRLKDAERIHADHARERFEARQARLEREERERAVRLAAKQAAIAARMAASPPASPSPQPSPPSGAEDALTPTLSRKAGEGEDR